MIRRKKERQKQLQLVILVVVNFVSITSMMLRALSATLSQINEIEYTKRDISFHRLQNLNRLIRTSDVLCRNELRMNRETFGKLCEMVRDIGGFNGTRNLNLEESVAMFLFTLAHHKKNRSIENYFMRSGESVSRHFNLCLLAILKLHRQLLKRPTPISEECEDDR